MNDLVGHALVSIQEARRYVWRNENDAGRDDILIDAINFVSSSIADEAHREFVDTTVPDRSGSDGVANATTTFVAASGAFIAGDVGRLLRISDRGFYRVVSVTNGTTIVLSGSPAAGTQLTWAFSETRTFAVGRRGLVNLDPYDLLELDGVGLYSDQGASAETLADDERKLLPVGRSQPGGTYLMLRTLWPTLPELQAGFGWEAEVSGFWGMPQIPETIKLAALQWIENIAKNPGSYASQTGGGYVITPDIDTATVPRTGMPPAVRHRLRRWERGGLVA